MSEMHYVDNRPGTDLPALSYNQTLRLQWAFQQEYERGRLAGIREERERIAARPGVALANPARATSKSAALGVLPRSSSRLGMIYAFILYRGKRGACDFEIEDRFNLSHQSASAARNTLMNRGLVRPSGEKRKTGTGHDALVWVDSALPLTTQEADRTGKICDPALRTSEIDAQCRPSYSATITTDVPTCPRCGRTDRIYDDGKHGTLTRYVCLAPQHDESVPFFTRTIQA